MAEDEMRKAGSSASPSLSCLCRRLAAGGLFLWLLCLVLAIFPEWDLTLVTRATRLRGGPALESAWIAFSSCSTYALTAAAALLLVAAIALRPLAGPRTALLTSGVVFVAGVTLIDFVVKPLVERPRPWVHHPHLATAYQASGFSFPSGHSFIAWSMVLPLALVLAASGDVRRRALAGALVVSALLVMASRMVLGVHYASDVLFSAGLVWIVAPFVLLALDRLRTRGRLTPAREMTLAVAVILLGAIEQLLN